MRSLRLPRRRVDLLRDRKECLTGDAERSALLRKLLKELEHARPQAQCSVDAAITAFVIRADENQIFLLTVCRLESPDRVRRSSLLRRDDVITHATLALENVDRRVVSGRRELARQDDMSVENRAARVRD